MTVLKFQELDTGLANPALVALHTHRGDTVAAIVHPPTNVGPRGNVARWSLAGDIDKARRPHGEARTTAWAMADAAQALEAELNLGAGSVSVEVES